MKAKQPNIVFDMSSIAHGNTRQHETFMQRVFGNRLKTRVDLLDAFSATYKFEQTRQDTDENNL